MDPAYFSAFAAVAGSMIGGLTSLATSWFTQHAQFRAKQIGEDLGKRQAAGKRGVRRVLVGVAGGEGILGRDEKVGRIRP
jgi:hypothetical protein